MSKSKDGSLVTVQSPSFKKLQQNIEDRIDARRHELRSIQEEMFDKLRAELVGAVHDILLDEWESRQEQQQQQPRPGLFGLACCREDKVSEVPPRFPQHLVPQLQSAPVARPASYEHTRIPATTSTDEPVPDPVPTISDQQDVMSNAECRQSSPGNKVVVSPTESAMKSQEGSFESQDTPLRRETMSNHLKHQPSAFEDNGNMLAFLEAKNWDSEAAEHPENIMSLEGEVNVKRHPIMQKVENLVDSQSFDCFIGMMIMVNSIVMGLSLEYEGTFSAESIGINGDDGNWPHADLAFSVLENIFAITFLVELTLRLSLLGSSYFKVWFNWMDFTIVVISILELYVFKLVGAEFPNVSFIRVVRIFKMVRVLRIVRVLKFFEKLRVLVAAVINSMASFYWSVLLLGVVQLIAAIFITQSLQSYLQDESVDPQDREHIYMFYGSFSRSIITMFEITVAPGTWASNGRDVIFKVSRYYAIFLMGYLALVSFAMIRVITAIFLKDTLALAAKDGEIVMANANRDPKYVKQIWEVFQKIDVDNSGTLSMEELRMMLKDDQTQAWLKALGIIPHEVKGLFTLMDDGDDEISFCEFITGIMRLKDPKVDLATILYENKKLLGCVIAVGSKVDKLTQLAGISNGC